MLASSIEINEKRIKFTSESLSSKNKREKLCTELYYNNESIDWRWLRFDDIHKFDLLSSKRIAGYTVQNSTKSLSSETENFPSEYPGNGYGSSETLGDPREYTILLVGVFLLVLACLILYRGLQQILKRDSFKSSKRLIGGAGVGNRFKKFSRN